MNDASSRFRHPYVAAAIGIVLAAAIIAFLLLRNNDDNSAAEPTGGAEAASLNDLRSVADAADFPVYWAGQKPGQQYELTITEDGNIFVRYLDPNVPIGSRDVASLTIGTYPVTNAYAALQAIAQKPGARTDQTPDGGLVVTNSKNPQSVYIAYPNTNYEIEVYDPNPKSALEVATSGTVQPVK